MPATPQVSVIITAYNEQAHVDRCLRSISSQIDPPAFQVVFVDDASEDSTLEIVRRFSSFFDLEIIPNTSNLGIGAAGAIGVSEASGRFVVRVDADDFVSEHFLHVLHLAASAPGSLQAYRSDYLTVDNSGLITGRHDSRVSPIACGMIMSRESVVQVGSYSPSLRVGEDVEFERRYGREFEIGHVPIPLYRYRIHENNTSRS